MDYLEREGRPSDQERTPPHWARCGNCGWIRELSDYTGVDDEDKYGLCVEQEPYARVERSACMSDSPCGGEAWVMT